MELLLQQIFNGLTVGSTYALVALGFSLTFSVLGVVNFTHPSVFMIAMFIALFTWSFTGNVLVVVVAVVIGTSLVALTVERIVLRPLRSPNILIPFLGTLAAGLFIDNAMAGALGPSPRAFPELIPRAALDLGPISGSPAQLTNIAAAFLVLVGVSYYVRSTKWGRATRAVAERADVAAAFGVHVDRVIQVTVIIAGVFAGIAGLVIAILYGTAWVYVGSLYAIKSMVCMLVSGNRHVEGVMAVGLALGIIEILVATYVSSAGRDAVAFVILIVLLFIKPTGIFGSYAAAD